MTLSKRLVVVEEAAQPLPRRGPHEVEVAIEIGLVHEVVRQRGGVVQIVHRVRPAFRDEGELA